MIASQLQSLDNPSICEVGAMNLFVLEYEFNDWLAIQRDQKSVRTFLPGKSSDVRVACSGRMGNAQHDGHQTTIDSDSIHGDS
jgi:hypothetical protein